ncbi:MAG: hypothetical protein Q7R33_10250 [Nitrosarchaeum sp.]|nr:hypothetical protein [Nitrosarchaeum sp.]
MKRYLVFLDKNVIGVETTQEILEFEDDASQEKIEDACADCLDTLIGNELDTGWNELTEEEYQEWKKQND